MAIELDNAPVTCTIECEIPPGSITSKLEPPSKSKTEADIPK